MIVINEPLAVLATLAIIVFGKSAAAFLLVKMFGHSKRTALTISASLAQIGEFAFILAGLGIALGMMSEHGRNLVLAGAILSIMLNRCCSPCWSAIWPKPKPSKSKFSKRRWKKRSRSRWTCATTRWWSATAASAACWAANWPRRAFRWW